MRFIASLVLSLSLSTVFANPETNTPENLGQYHMTMIKKPKVRLTKNWAFVIDTSHSMNQDRAEKAHKAFLIATQYPTDEMNFCMFTFNDKGVDRFRGWRQANPEEFKAAHNWARKKWQRGVLSYAGPAIKKALHLKRKELTIVLISDGGFTEGYSKIKQIIADGQAWRKKNGFGLAIIACIGVQNLYYRTGGKEPDDVNQQWLHDIGVDNDGGYSYVHRGKGPINPLRKKAVVKTKKISQKPKRKKQLKTKKK